MTTELEERIIALVKEVGTHAKNQAFQIGTTEFKSRDDPVTNVDRECERMFEDRLGTGFNYWGEEFGFIDNGAQQTVYIDPIDGTKSYTRGEFDTSFTATVMDQNQNQLVSVVYDFMRDITYVANGDDVKIIAPNGFATGLPRQLPEYKLKRILATKVKAFEVDKKRYRVDQQVGSVARSMAIVATGAYEAFHAPPYEKDGVHDIGDILAGTHILEAAGFKVSDLQGFPLDKRKMNNGIVAIKPGVTDLDGLYLRK